jgi:[ribosomal protein S18]-alanine N-acetyltransferase
MTPARMAEIHAAAFAGQDRAWPEAELAAMLSRPVIHAVAQGAQGFALLQILPPEAEIVTLAIDPTAQGQGLGTALLQRALRMAAEAGATTMFLEVAADNAPARALYARAGFAEAGRRAGYYARPGDTAVDALVLSRALGAAKTGKPFKS